ncbi:MerR family transcriptional regulator [Actinomadura sp. HBU206391]|uniref:MerR family transcriptional regulator n=1 Tax=Actinomadura sp. HBU206391 TaxID=2731692 RepID=UPI0016508FF3|nr:MerR family transcriptional regulator [Actinomadura sp. HBU206391]MBC6456620.1 MerR family transcriptional regulator [Actinomadura sp. HBU206391]
MKSSEELAIGELAERFGLPTHVLRYWESMGLLEPARGAGGQRSYEQADLARVALILMGKEAGFTLGELRTLLSTPNPMDHRDLLRRHAEELERRISRARAAKELIEHALACPIPFAECEHARDRIASRIPPPPPAGPSARPHSYV